MTHHLEKIISQFNKLPPNREEIEKDFKENNYNAQEIAEIAVEILGECFAEYIYAKTSFAQ